MAHLDGKMKEDGVPFNSIEDRVVIADFRQGMIGKSCVLISIRECVE